MEENIAHAEPRALVSQIHAFAHAYGTMNRGGEIVARASRPCASSYRHTGETPVPLPNRSNRCVASELGREVPQEPSLRRIDRRRHHGCLGCFASRRTRWWSVPGATTSSWPTPKRMRWTVAKFHQGNWNPGLLP